MGPAIGTGVSLAYLEETTRGTFAGGTPGSPSGTPTLMRATVRNINLKKDILETAEVSSTRQRSDVRHGFNRVEGEIGFELNMASFNDLIAYALGQDEGNVAGYSGTGWFQPSNVTSITLGGIDTAGQIATLTRGSGSWFTDGYRPGDWIDTTGFADTDNNSRWRIVAINTSLIITIAIGTVGASLTAQAGGTVAYVGRKTKIGTTLKTISLERGFKDSGAANVAYQAFRGVAINTMSLSIQPNALVGGTFGFLGMAGSIANASTSFSTPTAAATNSPFSAFDGSAYFASSGIQVGPINVNAGVTANGTNASFVPNVQASEFIRFNKGDVIRFSNQTSIPYIVTASTGDITGPNTTTTVTFTPPLVTTLTTSETVTLDYTGSATLTGMDLTIDNQRTLFPVVGSKFSQDVYEGVAKVTGTMNMLLSDLSQLTYFESEVLPGYVSIRLNELGTSNFMTIVLYRVKVTSDDIDPPQNGPIVQSMSFEALETTFGTFKEVLHIQRSV